MTGVFVFLALFAWDNAEFFKQVEKEQAMGYEWKYVGKQPADEYKYTLPVINERTGEKSIYWRLEEPTE